MCELPTNTSTDVAQLFSAIPESEWPVGIMDLGDVLIWPVVGTEDTFHFLPKAPGIVRNSDGSEQVSLIDAGTVAFLQLSAQLTVRDDRLEAIRSDLEDMLKRPVRLSFAPLDDLFIRIHLGENEASFASSTLPTLPPYNAMFNFQVPSELKSTVEAGLAGQVGRVAVSYQAKLTYESTFAATLSGHLMDPDGLLVELEAEHISAGLMSIAISQKWAKIEPGQMASVWPDGVDALVDQALHLVRALAPLPAGGTFSVALSQAGPVQVPFEVKADLGAGRDASQLFDAILPSAL